MQCHPAKIWVHDAGSAPGVHCRSQGKDRLDGWTSGSRAVSATLCKQHAISGAGVIQGDLAFAKVALERIEVLCCAFDTCDAYGGFRLSKPSE
jgi:hypothetical protein